MSFLKNNFTVVDNDTTMKLNRNKGVYNCNSNDCNEASCNLKVTAPE